jgi:nuclear transport factor 2 (NTF2) superfamily protein
MRHLCFASALVVAAALGAAAQVKPLPEEEAIRAVLARFYEGWNEHDADKMVSAYAEDGKAEAELAHGQFYQRRPARAAVEEVSAATWSPLNRL